MSRIVREKYEKLIELLDKAIPQTYALLEEGKTEKSLVLLENCQHTAITLGSHIERVYGEGTDVVGALEAYCEKLYAISVEITKETCDKEIVVHLFEEWKGIINAIKGVFEEEIPDKLEVVFLPYKVSMWDSLESIWMAANADENCDAYVVPIPYYDKDPKGNFSARYWEGEEFPKNVNITLYEEYDISLRQPDVIFIHNPYDEFNHITSVGLEYYSSTLRKNTKKLVYVPYFILPAPPVEMNQSFVLLPAVNSADYVFVQNEETRDFYVETLQKTYGNETNWKEKVVAIGSPKTDKLINTKKEDLNIPKEWEKKLHNKKVIFFNTNISMILNNPQNIIQNLKRILNIFKKHSEFVPIWREHPLTMSTLKAMTPTLLEEYLELRNTFIQEGYGIIDETSSPHMAMVLADCYFGAGGSLSAIYPVTGKPLLIMNYLYPEQMSEKEISIEDLIDSASARMLYTERNSNTLDLFLSNIRIFESLNEERAKKQSIRMNNLDGTVGEKIYSYFK